jgi:hypothetical protein
MGFLSGPITLESFRVAGSGPRQFGAQHIKTLERFAIDRIETASLDDAAVGFLAGGHLFDHDFNLEKNVIGEALHCAVRIDTNQIPAAVRKAWMQMEIAALAADNPSGRPTKAQRQEARETVEARCEEEARSGKFKRMQQFPVLWDTRTSLLHFGGTSPTASDYCSDLFFRAFELDLERLTAGKRALEWASKAKRGKAMEDVRPTSFHPDLPGGEVAWCDNETGNLDFVGNEFLLWLWWHWETQSETLALPDGSEVTGMLARTLALECPRGDSGKETISAEAPAALPEAAQAIRSGKLPRKAGLILVRHGDQYELVLQAEKFTVSGAKIRTEEKAAEGRGAVEDRLEALRGLNETLDLMFATFCERRISKQWSADLEAIGRWLKGAANARKRTA